MATSSGYKFDTCQYGKLSDSSAVGPGAGWGYLLNSCTDMLLQNCNAETFLNAGFQLAVSQAVIDLCYASNSTTGVLVGTNSIATIRRSTFDQNNVGIDATATTSSTDIIIKDCMVSHSVTNGIKDNGTPIYILDTRSFNPGPNSIFASTTAGTVITY